MGTRIHRLFVGAAVVAAVLIWCVLGATAARAQSGACASDGSCSVNTQWEQGKSSVWYIELQRQGEDYIRQGIAQENDSEIRAGLKAFDWGFAHQAKDGSFTGTSDPFHSTGMFVEAVAYSTIMLKAYRPKTYTLDQTYYKPEVSKLTAGCRAASNWLMTPAAYEPGQQEDAPYTSRYYITAAALGETGQLTGIQEYTDAAVPYVTSALKMQQSNGVNPEAGGYDVDYQEAGVLNAAHYYTTIQTSNPSLAKQVNNMMKKAMAWEAGRVDVNGNVDTSGSTRIGKEKNRDGTTKTLDVLELERSLYETYTLTRLQQAIVAFNRINLIGYVPSSAKIAVDGSCDYNTDWELHTRTKWNVQLQRAGVNWVEYGIQREDDSSIRKGLSTMDWAFAHQAADGTFTGSTTMFFSGAQFLEAAARTAIDLENYHPVTYTADASYYASEISKIKNGGELFANWMIQPSNASSGQKAIAGSTYSQYYTAAALQLTGVLLGNSDFQDAALGYVKTGLGMEQGQINPEAGKFDLNKQALGQVMAARYYLNGGDSSVAADVVSMLDETLAKDESYIGSDGTINWSSPDEFSITSAFQLGYTATHDQVWQVIYNRIIDWSVQ